jgi:hypothetical protein
MKSKLIISIFTMICVSSCSKEFTDLSPISERNAGSFYNTASDMEVAVNAIYNTLTSQGCYNQSYWVLQELRSDNTQWDGTGLAEEITVFDKFNEISTSNITKDAWTSSYLGVSRANIVLSRIQNIEMETSLKNRLIGEALFLRSLYYYNLATMFGNIPLILNETSSVAEGNSHIQVSASEVYAQVILDLTEAEAKLPTSYVASSLGRATKGAAAALLGKVYLTIGDKSNATASFKKVITMGYSLVGDYSNLWGVENEFNSESIFEVNFQGGLGNLGNSFTSQFNGDLSGSVTSGLRNIPEQNLLDTYEDGDLRYPASIQGVEGISTGWTIKYGTTNPFNDNDASNNWVVIRYADVLLMLAESLGESDEAYSLINQVRTRAGLASIDSSTPGSFTDKLLQERRVELAFENHRWFDLLRFNKAEAAISATGKSINGRLLFAIPQRELDLNSNFTQNPGY